MAPLALGPVAHRRRRRGLPAAGAGLDHLAAPSPEYAPGAPELGLRLPALQVTALLFGLGLGSGLYTRVIVPTFYLLFAWPFLGDSFWQPVALWAAYGLARSGHVWWLAWTAAPENPLPAASRLTFVLLSHSRWMYGVNAGLLAAAAAWLTIGGILS